MEIRELNRGDLESLLLLYTELDADNGGTSAEKAAEIWKAIESDPNIIYIGAVDGGRVVSTCFITIIPNLTRGCRPIGFAENVVTSREYRRQGLAEKVLRCAMEIAKERGCYKLILQSGAARTDAHRLYERLGFDGTSKKAFDMRL